MKTKFALVVATILLTACAEPIEQRNWVQTTVELKDVPGLADCTFSKIQTKTFSPTIVVIRCPNSATTTQYKTGGKSSQSVNVTVTENDRRLLQHINERNELLKALQKRNELLKSLQEAEKEIATLNAPTK